MSKLRFSCKPAIARRGVSTRRGNLLKGFPSRKDGPNFSSGAFFIVLSRHRPKPFAYRHTVDQLQIRLGGPRRLLPGATGKQELQLVRIQHLTAPLVRAGGAYRYSLHIPWTRKRPKRLNSDRAVPFRRSRHRKAALSNGKTLSRLNFFSTLQRDHDRRLEFFFS